MSEAMYIEGTVLCCTIHVLGLSEVLLVQIGEVGDGYEVRHLKNGTLHQYAFSSFGQAVNQYKELGGVMY